VGYTWRRRECAPPVRWYPLERGGDLGEVTEIAYH
jgi:hypothetical protein